MPSRQHRITQADDYRRVVRGGHKLRGRATLIYAERHLGEAPARFGFIVSKAVGGAVVRNRVRRRLKDIVRRHLQAEFSGHDVVIRALPATAHMPFSDLLRETSLLLARLTSAPPELNSTSHFARPEGAGMGAEGASLGGAGKSGGSTDV